MEQRAVEQIQAQQSSWSTAQGRKAKHGIAWLRTLSTATYGIW